MSLHETHCFFLAGVIAIMGVCLGLSGIPCSGFDGFGHALL